MNATPTLVITPKFSKYLFSILLVSYLGAGICLWATQLALFLQMAGSLLLVGHLIYVLRRYCWQKSARSLIKIVYHLKKDPHQTWELLYQRGDFCYAALCSSSFVTRYVLILNFKIPNQWRSVSLLLFPDSEKQDTLRRLRVVLYQYPA